VCKILIKRLAALVVSLFAACVFVLIVFAVATVVPTDGSWKAPKTFTVLGSFALAAGALMQAWKDSSDAPETASGRDTLSLFSWAVVCCGAVSVLVGSALG
jgi:hypothetical protein